MSKDSLLFKNGFLLYDEDTRPHIAGYVVDVL